MVHHRLQCTAPSGNQKANEEKPCLVEVGGETVSGQIVQENVEAGIPWHAWAVPAVIAG